MGKFFFSKKKKAKKIAVFLLLTFEFANRIEREREKQTFNNVL